MIPPDKFAVSRHSIKTTRQFSFHIFHKLRGFGFMTFFRRSPKYLSLISCWCIHLDSTLISSSVLLSVVSLLEGGVSPETDQHVLLWAGSRSNWGAALCSVRCSEDSSGDGADTLGGQACRLQRWNLLNSCCPLIIVKKDHFQNPTYFGFTKFSLSGEHDITSLKALNKVVSQSYTNTIHYSMLSTNIHNIMSLKIIYRK